MDLNKDEKITACKNGYCDIHEVDVNICIIFSTLEPEIDRISSVAACPSCLKKALSLTGTDVEALQANNAYLQEKIDECNGMLGTEHMELHRMISRKDRAIRALKNGVYKAHSRLFNEAESLVCERRKKIEALQAENASLRQDLSRAELDTGFFKAMAEELLKERDAALSNMNAMVDSVVDAMSMYGGVTDYEGLPIGGLNYLQGIRRLMFAHRELEYLVRMLESDCDDVALKSAIETAKAYIIKDTEGE